MCYFPYCLSYSSCDVSVENLVLDLLIIPFLGLSFILITCLLDIVLIICKEKFCFGHLWELNG